jgi:hypothetical protein
MDTKHALARVFETEMKFGDRSTDESFFLSAVSGDFFAVPRGFNQEPLPADGPWKAIEPAAFAGGLLASG